MTHGRARFVQMEAQEKRRLDITTLHISFEEFTDGASPVFLDGLPHVHVGGRVDH